MTASQRWRRGLAGVLLLVLASGSMALAQATERQRAFVYGINAAFATSYIGTFAPPSADTIYLLADQTSVLSPRMAAIYFWPITNEYKADWQALNQLVPGTLEILRNGQVIAQTEATNYTIHYTPRGAESDGQLFTGADATAAQARFAADQAAFQQASNEYYAAQQAWMTAVDEATKRRAAGESVALPPEPQPPAPLAVFSNGLNQGFPIDLPPGTYQVRLRQPDGTILSASQRALVMFDARRAAVGYSVLPETRWTTPERIDDLSDVIIGKVGSQLYLVPNVTREYPARAYALLQNPQQQVSAASDWTWVAGEPITSATLELLGTGQAPEQRSLTPYRVQQTPGAALGYQVQPFVADPARPDAKPDFVGYPLRLDQAGSNYEIRLRAENSTVLDGSTRGVRASLQPSLALLLALAVVPLAVGALVITRRRVRMRLPRNVAG